MAYLSHRVNPGCVSAQNEKIPFTVHLVQKCLKALMVVHINLVPVIQARPLEMLIIHFKAKRVDQVQPHLSGTA